MDTITKQISYNVFFSPTGPNQSTYSMRCNIERSVKPEAMVTALGNTQSIQEKSGNLRECTFRASEIKNLEFTDRHTSFYVCF